MRVAPSRRRSHTLTVASSLAEASHDPSGATTSARTQSRCPMSTALSAPVRKIPPPHRVVVARRRQPRPVRRHHQRPHPVLVAVPDTPQRVVRLVRHRRDGAQRRARQVASQLDGGLGQHGHARGVGAERGRRGRDAVAWRVEVAGLANQPTQRHGARVVGVPYRVRLDGHRAEHVDRPRDPAQVALQLVQLTEPPSLLEVVGQLTPQVRVVVGVPPPDRPAAVDRQSTPLRVEEGPVQRRQRGPGPVPEVVGDDVVHPDNRRVQPQVGEQVRVGIGDEQLLPRRTVELGGLKVKTVQKFVRALPQPFATTKFDCWGDSDVQRVDEAGVEELPDCGDTAADSYILAICGVECLRERILRGRIEEVECGVPQRDRGPHVMS